MKYLAHFQRYKLRYEVSFLFTYFFMNASLLATSVVMEKRRESIELPFSLWEPFIWEYSSALSSLLLFPCIVLVLRKYPFQWGNIKKSLAFYLLISALFSLSHVGLMVGMREMVYFLVSREYNFGDVWFELIYEYRKDLWSFIFFVIIIKGYQFIITRLQGEANPIAQSEEESEKVSPNFDRLLVKKLGKEFIIKVDDVQWLEASGNYVNLHIAERIYPIRATLTGLIEQLTPRGFSRIHRSHAIRLDMVESITPLPSGDSEVRLTTDKVLTLSRRYKDSFKNSLG